jgi:hypothetical protein
MTFCLAGEVKLKTTASNNELKMRCHHNMQCTYQITDSKNINWEHRTKNYTHLNNHCYPPYLVTVIPQQYNRSSVKLTPTAKMAAHSSSYSPRFYFTSSHLQSSFSNIILYTPSLLTELHAKDMWQEMSFGERKTSEVTEKRDFWSSAWQ